MKTKISSSEARTKLFELLRKVNAGKSFTITNRGRAVADLVPTASDNVNDKAEGVKRLQAFMRKYGRVKGVNVKELIEEGRD